MFDKLEEKQERTLCTLWVGQTEAVRRSADRTSVHVCTFPQQPACESGGREELDQPPLEEGARAAGLEQREVLRPHQEEAGRTEQSQGTELRELRAFAPGIARGWGSFRKGSLLH